MPATFESLAAELREQIYEYVWAGNSVILKDKSILHIPPDPRSGPAPGISSVYPPSENPAGDGDDDASSSEDGSESGDEGGDGEDEEEDGADAADEGDEEDDAEDEEEDKAEDDEDDEEPVIEFNCKAFLDENRDDDDYDLDSDENSEADSDDEQAAYTIASTSRVDSGLLYVSRKLNSEALPVFYRSHNFIFDTDAVSTMRFLMALPPRAQSNVSSVSLTWFTMDGSEPGSRPAWSGRKEEPKFSSPEGTTMTTPFGAFLAQKIHHDKTFPRLKEISFYFPFGNERDWYCTYAPLELGRLLLDNIISKLNYVFTDDIVARVIDKDDSTSCYESMLGRHAYLGAVLQQEFEEFEPMPEGPGYYTPDNPVLAWMDDRDEYVKRVKRQGTVGWQWSDRGIKWLEEEGPVQAVISMWLKDDGEGDAQVVGEAEDVPEVQDIGKAQDAVAA